MRFGNFLERKIEKNGSQNDLLIVYPDHGGVWKQVVEELKKRRYTFFVADSDHKLEYLNIDEYQDDDMTIILCENSDANYAKAYDEARSYVTAQDRIIELFPRFKVGKYSYGPLTNKSLTIERIGAFCSFAANTDVVENHDVYISSHEFLSYPRNWDKHPAYIRGTKVLHKRFFTKTIIGNDVWIGTNSIIIAGCNIGNGAIIGAGSIVTKDVPDYAVVAGNPARIIRYRYADSQIKMLNKIAWWEWTDEKIVRCYDDFYLDVDDFIEKHMC